MHCKKLPVEDVDGVLVAVKRLEFAESERDTFHVRAFLREISITSEASMAPFVVDVVAKHARVERGNHVAFVGTRYCEEGSLYDCLAEFVRLGGKLDARPFFPLRLTSIYAYEMITALAILHRLGIAHNDIKLDNIFVQTPHHLRLGDFGLACRYTPGQTYVHNGGTRGFASPERMRGLAHDLERSDVWSLGCCLHALYTGALPGESAPLDPAKGDALVKMIASMLQPEPDERPTFAELCLADFYAQGKREFEIMFGYAVDPSVYVRDCGTGFEGDSAVAPPLKTPVSPRVSDDPVESETDDPMRSSPRGGLLRRLRALAGTLSPRGKNKATE